MNDTYYNDYFASGFTYEPYPTNYPCEQRYNQENRNSSSSSRVDSFLNPSEGFARGNMQANIYEPYKLTNPPLPVVSGERERLLLEVQKYEFAMWDLNLYLNTHPTDRNVMMMFDQYRNSYIKAAKEYESRFGPLEVSMSDTNSNYWPWNKCPWPWEGE